MSKFKTGDKVKYIGKDHREMPEFYPEIGTIGTVVKESGDTDWYIQWPKGSTSREDCWYCDENDIELVVDENMTNEEIWEMLESKMRKNGLKKKMGALYCGNNLTNGYWVYTLNDAHNAIATAYRSGYLRAMKGRPFKFGEKKEKKKGGHWEPVNPNNLPKEGTKVRYSRECEVYGDGIIRVGDTGVVRWDDVFGLKIFGIELDEPRVVYFNWFGFDNNKHEVTCLDMWVEDDE